MVYATKYAVPRSRSLARPRATAPAADAPLTRERILATGLAVLARDGAAGLSMRVLADALGTAPMSLYRHVRSKDELLSGIVALALERLELDVPGRGAWTERAAALMRALREQLRRTPPVVTMLMQHGQYTPALLRVMNTLLCMLREAGFPGAQAVAAAREIMWSTLGFVAAEIQGPTFSPAFYLQAMRVAAQPAPGELRPEDVAEVAAHMSHLITRDLDEVFASMLRHLLSGLSAELGHTATTGPAVRLRRGGGSPEAAGPRGNGPLDGPRRPRHSTPPTHKLRSAPSGTGVRTERGNSGRRTP